MSRFHDDNTAASDPGGVRLCPEKLEQFRVAIPFPKRLFVRIRYPDALIDEHLQLGDSRAAVVLQVAQSLCVAAYSDEIDGVAILNFPSRLANRYQLHVGSRLLTVNTYRRGNVLAPDLVAGPLFLGRYVNFYPLIAEFLSDQTEEIAARKGEISEDEWGRTNQMGISAFQVRNVMPRNGNPYLSDQAAANLAK